MRPGPSPWLLAPTGRCSPRPERMGRAFNGHAAEVTSVAFSPDGKLLASASTDNTVKVWTLQGREPVRILSRHTSSVTSVAFSPDGKTLASTSEDGTVKLWDMQSGLVVRTLHGHASWAVAVAFSPNG